MRLRRYARWLRAKINEYDWTPAAAVRPTPRRARWDFAPDPLDDPDWYAGRGPDPATYGDD